MPVCPKCGVPFSYTETHICEGRDRTKLWSLASVAMGAVIGAPVGLFYAKSVIQHACAKPDATNLCGLTSARAIPFYIAIGAVVGASVAAFAVVLILGRRKA
jgi:hypothetical protein